MADVASPLLAASSAADRLRASMGHPATHSARQDEILDALETLFLERGLRKVTVDQLVSAARCSRATLYELASTKETLFLLVLDRMWRRLGERARQVKDEAADVATQIKAFVCEAITIFRPEPTEVFFEDIAAYAPARRLFEDHIAIGLSFLADLIAEGIECGQFRAVNPGLAARMLTAGALQIAGEGEWEGEAGMLDAVRDAVDIVIWGLADENSTSRPPATAPSSAADAALSKRPVFNKSTQRRFPQKRR